MSGWRATFLIEQHDGRERTPVVHIDLDPRCLSLEMVHGAAPRVELTHVPACRCGQAFAMLAHAQALRREDGSDVVTVVE